MRILLVDDEKLIVKGIKFSLEQEGMQVSCAYDGEEALNKALNEHFDVIVLDIMLPKMSGFDVLKKIRETSSVPIIMLTAKDGDLDKITGLEYGADDYIVKPFNILEVKARIKALFRRSSITAELEKQHEESDLKVGKLLVDRRNKRVYADSNEIALTIKEFDLLVYLMLRPGSVFSREVLLSEVWGYEYLADERTVDVHIRRLREKIEDNPSEPAYILTKWGVGYYFVK